MKLCIIANPGSPHTRRWISHFANRGFEIHLIGYTPLPRPPQKNVTFYNLAEMINIRKARFALWGYKTRRLIQEIQPDILHIHGIAGYGWLGAAANFHPFLVTVHGSDVLLLHKRSWLHRKLSLWTLRKADYITCVSAHLARQVRKLGVTGKPLEVAYLGVDTAIFHPADNLERLRLQLHCEPGKIVLSLRAVRDIYNPLDIAESIPLVLERVPSARFVIFTYNADPELLARFKATVEKHRAAGAVRYVNALSNDREIAAYYQIADVALSLASSDGTPKSVQEAMACGAVPVLGDLPTLHEWVTHEKEGLYADIGDIRGIANAITRLLKDDDLRNRIQKNAVGKIRHKANQEQCLQRYENIYTKLASSTANNN